MSISLQEYLAQSQRGHWSNLMGQDFLKKQTYLQVSNIFTETYGRKVWEAMNNRTVFFNAVKKVGWGPTTGWRNRTDRGSGNSQPITETGALPTIDVSNYANISSLPRIVGTVFGVTLKSQFTGMLEGGIGDALAVEREAKSRDHIKEINQELLLSGSTIVSTGGASTTGAVAQGEYLRVGDTFGESTAGDTAQTITAISGAGVLTFTGGYTLTDGQILYVKSRAGFTSLDDIVEEDGRTIAGVAVTSHGPEVYNLTTRTAATYAAGAVVLDNDGTSRDISLSLLDQAIRYIRQNGGTPRLILCGWDQYFKIQALLQAYQRYVGKSEVQVGVGDERTLPGTETGLTLATYLDVPILPDHDVCKAVDSNDADLGSRVYVLDTEELEIAMAVTTQYVENRDFFAANAMVVRGLYYTMGELRCQNIWHQAKITDLST